MKVDEQMVVSIYLNMHQRLEPARLYATLVPSSRSNTTVRSRRRGRKLAIGQAKTDSPSNLQTWSPPCIFAAAQPLT